MGNDIKSKWNDYLDKRVQDFSDKSIARYATNPDGSINEHLAENLKIEIKRCESMGHELEIYEPMRWVFIQTALAFIAGTTFKFFQKDKKISTPVLIGLALETAALNAIHMFRIFPRFDARLRGGVAAALEVEALRAAKVEHLPSSQEVTLQNPVQELPASVKIPNSLVPVKDDQIKKPSFKHVQKIAEQRSTAIQSGMETRIN